MFYVYGCPWGEIKIFIGAYIHPCKIGVRNVFYQYPVPSLSKKITNRLYQWLRDPFGIAYVLVIFNVWFPPSSNIRSRRSVRKVRRSVTPLTPTCTPYVSDVRLRKRSLHPLSLCAVVVVTLSQRITIGTVLRICRSSVDDWMMIERIVGNGCRHLPWYN